MMVPTSAALQCTANESREAPGQMRSVCEKQLQIDPSTHSGRQAPCHQLTSESGVGHIATWEKSETTVILYAVNNKYWGENHRRIWRKPSHTEIAPNQKGSFVWSRIVALTGTKDQEARINSIGFISNNATRFAVHAQLLQAWQDRDARIRVDTSLEERQDWRAPVVDG
ncbi:uncharacterized protein LOC130282002 isoform X2 [Hyla sarda]|uniref:uncharacterized protein LOC130282002 isoform X2 n=1 Tax=Hyla sarda TaxID=327740 RepID=UPI0024C40876|nr:uncharacterized protein LOC130282002 isoform X2 [Hyla sarda]